MTATKGNTGENQSRPDHHPLITQCNKYEDIDIHIWHFRVLLLLYCSSKKYFPTSGSSFQAEGGSKTILMGTSSESEHMGCSIMWTTLWTIQIYGKGMYSITDHYYCSVHSVGRGFTNRFWWASRKERGVANWHCKKIPWTLEAG